MRKLAGLALLAALIAVPASADNTSGFADSTAQRAASNTDANNQSVGASATFSGTVRDLGVAPTYSRINAGFYSSQTGTAQLQACLDSGCAAAFTVATTALAVNTTATLTSPVLTRYWRVVLVNGSTAALIYVVSSTTAN